MSWTQPCCEDCWVKQHGTRRPTRVTDKRSQTCCYCGRITHGGIFVRVNPATVNYPTERST